MNVCLRCGAGALDVDRSVRVVYANPKEDGTWQVGCSFTRPLSEMELALVLRVVDQRTW